MKSRNQFLHNTPYSPLAASLVAFGFLLAGCATTHQFEVDAYSTNDSRAARTSYRLIDATGGVHEGVVPFADVASDIKTAFSGLGLYEAPEGTAPSLIVAVEYGYLQPRSVTHSFREVVYLPTPSRLGPSGSGLRGSGSTMPPLGFGPSGADQLQHRTIQTTSIIQPKFLRLTARFASTEAPRKQAWMIEVRNNDGSTELRSRLRLMTAVAMDFLGKNSEPNHIVTIAGNDRRVRFIERGL